MLILPRLFGWGATLSLGARFAESSLAAEGERSIPLDDPKYADLLKELVQTYQFNLADLRVLFSKVELAPAVIEKFERPAERLPFYEYRRKFITDELILRGQDYLKENLKPLMAIEEAFGVPKEIILGILGVETKFGQKGIEKYQVFNVLNTAYARYPRREGFYRQEIIEYLLLCREEGIDPFAVNGSYAGAFGVPQFMPSSFRKYAVDYDRDGRRDIWDSKWDIFASVANYLKAFGWKWDGLIRLPTRILHDSAALRKQVGMGIRKTLSVSAAARLGVQIPRPSRSEDEVSLAFYQPQEGKEALIALFENFRVITRYNFSLNYGLVVTDLSEILAHEAL